MSYRGEIIKSSQNKFVSIARALSDRKQRQKSSLYRFDGVKLMCEAAKKGVADSRIFDAMGIAGLQASG